MMRLAIDFENPAPDWWSGGGRDLWDAITEGMGESAVVVDEGIAESWLAEASKLPGWAGGPEHAPHPIASGSVDGAVEWEE